MKFQLSLTAPYKFERKFSEKIVIKFHKNHFQLILNENKPQIFVWIYHFFELGYLCWACRCFFFTLSVKINEIIFLFFIFFKYIKQDTKKWIL